MDCMDLVLTCDVDGLGKRGDHLAVRPGHPSAAALIVHSVFPNYGRFAGLLTDGTLEPANRSDAAEIARRLAEADGSPPPRRALRLA